VPSLPLPLPVPSSSNGNVKPSLVLSCTCWQIIPHLIIMIIARSECQSRERKCFRQDCWNNRLTMRPTVWEWFIPKTVNQITATAEQEGPAKKQSSFQCANWLKPLLVNILWGEAPLFTLTKRRENEANERKPKGLAISVWLSFYLVTCLRYFLHFNCIIANA